MTHTASSHIPESAIRNIRESCSLVDIISEHVSLKKVGGSFKGLCPFHSEKTPSFYVHEEKKFFHCFGCGASGDVFTFLIKHDRLSFQEAARLLANKLGLALPDSALTPEQRREERERETLLEINAAAARFFSARLHDDPHAEPARSYLRSRGISPESTDAFGLGYAPESWDGLVRHLGTQDIALEQAQKTGLVISKTRGKYYDRFRNRIIFPITSASGRIIGFGGRIIGPGEPKYLNSPESPVYSKRQSLYGLNMAAGAIHREKKVVIVEGYLDVITLHQAGITHAVAALGTALTEHQIRLLKRYTDDIVTVFDADPSGERAMVRSLEPFLRNSVPARLVLLPGGEDPDSYVRRHGAAAFTAKVEGARPLLDFVIDRALQKHVITTPRGKVNACNDIVPLLKMIPDALEQELYIQSVAQRLAIRQDHMYSRIGIRRQPPAPLSAAGARPAAAPKGHAEKMILRLILQHPGVIDIIEKDAVLDEFADPALRRLGLRIIQAYRAHGALHAADIIDSESDDQPLRQLLGEISFQEDIPGDPSKALEDCIRDIRLKKNSRRLEKVTLLLKQAEAERDEILSLQYLREHQSLLQEKKSIVQYKLNAQQT